MQFSMVMQLSVGELHRRHDEAVRIGHEGPRAPGLFAARDHVQKLHAARDMRGVGKTGADMLGGAGAAGIERVEVHLEIVGDVAADHRALEEVHIVERMGDAAPRHKDPCAVDSR
jgi:hypothetical protein